MSHRKNLFVILLSIFFACNIFFVGETSAYTPGDAKYTKCMESGSNVDSEAKEKICRSYGNGTARFGAQWINDDSDVTNNHDVDATGVSGTMTVYMHRKVYNDFSGNNNSLCSKKLAIYNNGLSGYVDEKTRPSGGEVDFLYGFSDELCGGSNYTNGWSNGGTVPGTLDVERLKQARPDCEQNGECDVTVYIYRCAKTNVTARCGTDKTVIHIILGECTENCDDDDDGDPTCDDLIGDLGGYVAATPHVHGLTQGLSGVKKASSTKWEHTVFVRPHADHVKFAHCYFPDTHKITVTTDTIGENHPGHYKGLTDCEHCECDKTCKDKDGHKYTCYENCEYDDHAPAASTPYYPASQNSFWLSASPSSYLFDREVVGNNNPDFFYNADANKAQSDDYGYMGTAYRNANFVAIVSPKSSSSSYMCHSNGPGKNYINSTGAYTIIGTDPRDCATANGNPWDPGITFEQHVNFSGTMEVTAHGYTNDCPEEPHDDPHEIHTSGPYYVLQSVTSGSGSSTPAEVVVPYNFDTEIKVDMVDSPVVYPGTDTTSKVTGKILPKYNEDVDGSTYATITPGTDVILAQFVLAPDKSKPNNMPGRDNYASSSQNGPYLFAQALGGQDIQTFDLAKNENFNDEDNENGYSITPKLYHNGEIKSIVPDLDAGYKFCSVVGISHTDSHGIPGEGVPSGGNGKYTGAGQTEFGNWRISNVTCRTIAKKPTFQAWSGGVYTRSNIRTSTIDKCLRSGVRIEQNCANNSDKRVFGSWSEYEVIALGQITNFASAAGFGFSSTPDAHGGGGRDGGLPSDKYGDSNTGASTGKYYNYSHATIANKNVTGPSANLGLSGISVDGAFLSRILSRYSKTTEGYSGCTINGLTEDEILGVGSDTVQTADDHLVVFRCKGTATIKGNIITGHKSYSGIDKLPQVIIIAKNINIEPDVTEVDAWLIATDTSADGGDTAANGIVNTCKGWTNATNKKTGTSSASDKNASLHDDICSKQLTVNGPVIAGRVKLNRTYGAFPGDNSIEPAEVFNLRADTYLWAYSQSEDFHQAVTTYTRELAPRY